MAMKHCPVCGEKYSDTYRRCPFCEEEQTLRSGNTRRKGGHRVAQKGPSLLSPLLVIAILVMVGVLVYLLFGSAIAEKLGMGKSSAVAPPVASVSSAASSGASTSAGASGSASGGAASSSGIEIDPAGLPATLTISKSDFTMNVGDSPVQLTVSGGGSYTWESSDDGIASVDESGNVIAISSGTVTVTAYNESAKGECIVRVKGSGAPNAGGAAPTSGGTLTLSKSDVSIAVGESFVLSASGVSGSAAYATSDSAVVSVSGTGRVTGVGRGSATVTVTVGGKSASCIVRVVR